MLKTIPKWEQYEWLITKIFHDNKSLTSKVLHNAKLIGKYSEKSRQIDILIEDNNIKTIIECKHYSKPVDLKDVETFLSMFNDIKASYGILISSSGFTKSSYKRISEMKNRIHLEHINWEKAYSSFVEQSYGRITDICNNCIHEYKIGREVPGLLCWEHGLGLEINNNISLYSIGKCLKCGKHTIYCDPCGWITTLEEDETCCELRNLFLKLYSDR